MKHSTIISLGLFFCFVGLILGSEERACPIACTYEHEPVCGRRCEYTTFGNKCELNKANKCGANPPYTYYKKGECPIVEDN